jgi:hypothetical protein
MRLPFRPFLLYADDGGGGVPEAFEVVEGAFFGGEDVDDDVAVVHEDPAGVGLTLAAEGLCAVGFGRLFHRLDDGLDLAVGGAVGDDEVVGEGSDVADVQQEDILRLLVGDGVYDVARQFVGFQTTSSGARR